MKTKTATGKKAKTPTTKPEIILNIILDESGSMRDCREKTVEGLNEYLGGLLDDPSADYLVTFTKFDSHPGEPTCRVVTKMKSIKEVGPISLQSYVPRGSTPLLDAIGTAIRSVEPEVGDKAVITIIVTDGYENASREWTNDKVKALISEKDKTGKWTFVYLGADINAFTGAASLGISAGNAMSYTKSSTPTMFRSALVSSTRSRSHTYATSGGIQAASLSYFADAGLDNSKVYNELDTLAQNVINAGKVRAASQTPEERAKLAQKAAQARWKK